MAATVDGLLPSVRPQHVNLTSISTKLAIHNPKFLTPFGQPGSGFQEKVIAAVHLDNTSEIFVIFGKRLDRCSLLA